MYLNENSKGAEPRNSNKKEVRAANMRFQQNKDRLYSKITEPLQGV